MPTVSVVMPTHQRAAFLPRALDSLLAQSLTDWELVVVDDGSTDGTAALVRGSGIPRLVLVRHPVNRGPGAALNAGTAAATGRYLAYLPDDDLYDPDHLRRCVDLLETRPDAYAAFGGVRWHDRVAVNVRHPVGTALLRPDLDPERLAGLLADGPPDPAWPVPSGNPLALVQVVHRRGLEQHVRWTERAELVSDTLEYDFWRALLAQGATFAPTGAVTCEWTDHPDQHHKIVSGRGLQTADWRDQVFGLSAYRRRYGVPAGVPLRWRPAAGGLPVDEPDRYRGLDPAPRRAPDGPARRILVAGALGFNPDRLLAFPQAGHEVWGTWLPTASFWDTAGPLPFPGVGDVPFDDRWADRVAALRPDVIYAQLGWNAVPFLHELLVRNRRGPRVPYVFHFKESPFAAIRAGYWPQLRELVLGADGRVFAGEAARDWFAAALRTPLDGPDVLILDGEYPLRHWHAGDPAPRLSDTAGGIHTVSVGRTVLEPVEQLAARGIHLHVYTLPYMRAGSRWIGAAAGSDHLHLHDAVQPRDWVRELSRYDAAWMHVGTSANGGEIRRADWADLNLPARIGTYAAAGLPWILRRNAGHRVATADLARRLGVAVEYDDLDELAGRLRAEQADRAGSAAMRRQRDEFTFDAHVDRLTRFFTAVGTRAARTGGTAPTGRPVGGRVGDRGGAR